MASLDLREQATDGWDATASSWVRWWRVWERAAQPVSDRLVARARIRPGQVVLDLATGVGEPAMTAARRVGRRGRVVATDSSPAMLRAAAARAEAAALTNITFQRMDAERPDLTDIAFDAILCRWGFMFVPDLDGALCRLCALLKPGGRIAAAAWGSPDEVPMIATSAAAAEAVAPLGDTADEPLHPFRLCHPGILTGAMRRAGLADIRHEALPVTFEFASAEEYTRFRRDMTTLDARLAEHHPPDRVEAAWQAVTEAARAFAVDGGGVRFINTALCYSARRVGD